MDGIAPLDQIQIWIRETAAAWALPDTCAHDLRQVAYELAANALEHTRSRTEGLAITLVLDCTGALTVEVRDNGREDGAAPAIVTDADARWMDCGRGLLLVDGLSTWRVTEAVPHCPRLGHVVAAKLHEPAAA
ncbi:ATP-binding protein [Nocardiopsis dassonvillei]|uniref:ATP-binding protein n=1 Tax=Nocardiopsis dassonvillei TaxID=2014 RepID=UPI00200FFADA|nr:ATP-binding protein [Nocardiopsis dassonvillei]MCK9870309.1 ATP-binding protein [Nocardiopsis dassonvillei]